MSWCSGPPIISAFTGAIVTKNNQKGKHRDEPSWLVDAWWFSRCILRTLSIRTHDIRILRINCGIVREYSGGCAASVPPGYCFGLRPKPAARYAAAVLTHRISGQSNPMGSFHVQGAKKSRHHKDVWIFGDPYGNRTHITAVKGRCLNLLTNGPGSGNLTRTDDTPGMNRMLYQLSYAAIFSCAVSHGHDVL